MSYTTRNETGYLRETDGALALVGLLRDDDGALCDPFGHELTRTDETTELRGWGDSDGPARVWRNEGGREILVPEPDSCAACNWTAGDGDPRPEPCSADCACGCHS